MTTFAIQTHSLVKTYGTGRKQIRAVDGLSLNVPEGSIYGLLGRNSAGKTTTIRMAMGLARPTSGSIEVFGLNPAKDPERVRVLEQVGYVPEDKTLVGSLTARKLLELNRSFYPATWSDALARKVCDRLELPLDTIYPRLSLGNKTKSTLAAAIAQRSRLLILDEPTTGLDPVVMDELLRLLVEDCTAEGRTIFLSTHQLPEIEQIADHIGIMDRGKILLEGSLDDIRSSFRRLTVTGAALPAEDPSILSTKREGHATQYIVRDAPDTFAQNLQRNGAIILDAAPLSLTEIFLEVCRRSEKTEETREEVSA
ncbi:ABC transporter ATP-binding protein [Granulicella mallensis]|uniref:ABC-2 type transport system ATP-binding protein n=1 Tax=Granulicella mallensis TaxID=940614 RepID=A0A7W7ZPU0_9BACT|nr:ABC transporter ATP-binding protein [Granulicella mallensis]MBB5063915.1 ABC-2 type transport system ATP-binding protein [Granulicella mallensis]